jgi:hypothetical protein
MRDLAVPFKSTYEYTCTGGTLSIDGALPSGFTFSGNTLTFNGPVPSDYGMFKLKATANDGSGKTNSITITYYGVTTIAANTCRFLYTDGRVSDEQILSISYGTLSLSPFGDDQKLLKAVYFGELNDVTTIDDDFLYECSALTSIDLSGLTNLTTISDDFLFYCCALTSIDLSGLTNLTTIGDYFLFYCYGLTSIDLFGLTKLTTIGD